jgi:hypothetical protein
VTDVHAVACEVIQPGATLRNFGGNDKDLQVRSTRGLREQYCLLSTIVEQYCLLSTIVEQYCLLSTIVEQ